MKISIRNFKCVEQLTGFPIKSINILAGANSGGKRSIIQAILLIKQSLEAAAQDSPLKLNKPYISLGRFESLIRKQADEKILKLALHLEEDDLAPRLRQLMFPAKRPTRHAPEPRVDGFKELVVEVAFRRPTDRVVVNDFKITINASETHTLRLSREPHGHSHKLVSNAPDVFFQFDKPLRRELAKAGSDGLQVDAIFNSFFPALIEAKDPPGASQGHFYSDIIGLARASLTNYFRRISYLGPLRDEPHEYYHQDDDLITRVGNRGENAAFLLAKDATTKISYKTLSPPGGQKTGPSEKSGKLATAVNYWFCDVFGLAAEIKVQTTKTNRDLFTVAIKNAAGFSTPITQVGFGVSQVFPILVEGLRPASGKRLIILEQPEIHLHPRVQAALFDFIRLSGEDVAFLIETHSDHFITRMRRRIAEDQENTLAEKINLTFVEGDGASANYRQIEISEMGIFESWPTGFFDQADNDLRALIKAQASKRRAGV